MQPQQVVFAYDKMFEVLNLFSYTTFLGVAMQMDPNDMVAIADLLWRTQVTCWWGACAVVSRHESTCPPWSRGALSPPHSLRFGLHRGPLQCVRSPPVSVRHVCMPCTFAAACIKSPPLQPPAGRARGAGHEHGRLGVLLCQRHASVSTAGHFNRKRL